MNKKDIIRENIRNAGYRPGKSVKGKGLEVFSLPSRICSAFKDFDKLFQTIEKFGVDKVFVREISTKVEGKEQTLYFEENYQEALAKFPIKELMYSDMKDVGYISICDFPELKTYIKVSDFDTSLESQQEMIRILIRDTEDKEIVSGFKGSSYDELDNTIEFSNTVNTSNAGWLYNGDYTLFHGPNICLDNNEVERIDGRMEVYSDRILDDFWEFTMSEDGDSFEYIDPKEKVSIYARKGKDWYVTSGMEQEQIFLTYKQDDGEFVESEFWYFAKTASDELVEKVAQYVRAMKDSLEIESFIANEIDFVSSEEDDGEYSSSSIFNRDLLRENFKNYDEYDFMEIGHEIMDFVDWEDKTWPYSTMVSQAYEKYLKSNMDNEDILFGKFKHLQDLKKIAKKEGNEVVYSKVTSFSDECQYAIKSKKEEYHFLLGELFKTSAKKFYEMAIKQIAKRKVEKIERKKLMRKAKKVFVGFTDSTKSGNCASGTQAFCREHGIDLKKIGGIRGDKLLELSCDQFTRRAVIYKIKRY